MNKIQLLLAVFGLSMFISCKKDYTCMCSNPYIDVEGFKITDTKRQAKKRCEAYMQSGKLNYTPDKCTLVKWFLVTYSLIKC